MNFVHPVFIIVLVCDIKSAWTHHLDYLQKTSIVFAIAAQETPLETKCQVHLNELKNAVRRKDTWAMKVLDSSAHKNPGFILGNGFWLGSAQGCLTTHQPLKLSLSNTIKRSMKEGLISDVAPFEMEYKVVHLNSNSPWQIDFKIKADPVLHLGLCLPKSCSNEEVFNITRRSIGNGLIEDFKLLEFRPEVFRVKDLKLNGYYFTRTSLLLFVALTSLTLFIYYLSQKGFKSSIIQSFNLRKHLESLFSYKESSEASIPVINGYKTILCSSFVIAHVLFFSYFTINNKGSFLSTLETSAFQVLAQTPVLVEGFFVISAFLSCKNFLSNEKLIEEIRKSSLLGCISKYLRIILYRYFRLVPLYLVVMLITDFTTAYSNEVSPFFLEERYDEVCPKFWWRNVLLIQNWFPYEEICMNWSWSTACDMQFFMFVTAILFIYVKKKSIGKLLIAFAYVFSIIWFAMVALKLHYAFSVDIRTRTIIPIYMSSFYRFAPYFCGTVAAWILHEHKNLLTEMSPKVEKQLWNLSYICFLGIIFMEMDRSLSTIPTILIAVLGHHSNSLFVCWILLASATGKKVWWTEILEKPVFQPFCKLSYGIYLINSVLASFIFSLSENSTNFDIPLMVFISSGCLLITYILSILFHILYEAPYLKVSKILFDDKVKKVC